MMKALVVDDSKAIRNMLARILVRNGFEVLQAEGGFEALNLLEGEDTDLDLMCVDFNMPEMNGLELLAEMRDQPRFDDLPVMMVTTETHVEFITSALACGANEYVMKPFTEDMIADKLRVLGLLPY
ncbi:two-component system, chemotaxis family, response regulator CheY [Granulicella rosea]|uniref:Two-component system, chemotaxis family, response regulator CheY n=1 Tax=Granulicella rosea TaxID=474952 RepID=A0A239CX99_9BACT|nr:response regulator [Granulicella rosea]SNS23983.1 two-component system, chemotaxis family, response regulator CheY [Granulicella rosea]